MSEHTTTRTPGAGTHTPPTSGRSLRTVAVPPRQAASVSSRGATPHFTMSAAPHGTLRASCCSSSASSPESNPSSAPPGQQQLQQQLAQQSQSQEQHGGGVASDAATEPPAGPYRTVLLNDDVLLFETMLARGQKLPMHSHPRPHLRYTFTAAVQKHTWPDGSSSIQQDKQGEYEWRDTLDHAVENVGEGPIHSLVFEFNRHEEDVRTLFSGGSLLWNLAQFQPDGLSVPDASSASSPPNTMPVDNDRIRALEVTLDPGAGSLPLRVGRRVHGGALLEASLASQGGHAPTLFFALEPWHALISVTAQTQMHVHLDTGQALWCSSGIRAFENVGTRRTRLIVVALKPQHQTVKAKL